VGKSSFQILSVLPAHEGGDVGDAVGSSFQFLSVLLAHKGGEMGEAGLGVHVFLI